MLAFPSDDNDSVDDYNASNHIYLECFQVLS